LDPQTTIVAKSLLFCLEVSLSAVVTNPLPAVHQPFTRRQSLGLVFCCTLLGAAAQVLMKSGANQMAHPGLVGVVVSIFTSLPLFAGYALYGLSTLLLVLALRDGELSLLYPVIALTYVWVTVLSLLIFRDTINPWKLVGIALIVCGVGVLGRNGRS
jgi:multidrug transporter EmrE-like cation transporter